MSKFKVLLIFVLTISFVATDDSKVSEIFKNAKDINESPSMQEILRKLRQESREIFKNGTDATPFIVGGINAAIGQIPHQVVMAIVFFKGEDYKVQICGGSMIDEKWILTAAHCAYENFDFIIAYFGIVNTTADTDCHTRIDRNDLILHHEYNHDRLWNDVALLRISNPPENFFSCFRVVKMPSNYMDYDFVGYTSRVSGFGSYSDTPIIYTERLLKYVNLPIITNEECGSRYIEGTVRDTNICQGTTTFASSCSGDSGGPLTVNIDGTTILIGVVSFVSSVGCQKGYPAGFARVTSFLPWIQEVTKIPFLAPTTPRNRGIMESAVSIVLLVLGQTVIVLMKF